MLNRIGPLALGVCAFVCASTLAQAASTAPGSGYIFELPGVNSVAAELQGFPYNTTLSAAIDATGPNGTRQLIAKPDGTKIYALGSGSTGLQSVGSAFTPFSPVNGLGGLACTAAMTPDGKYLFVGVAANCASSTFSSLVILDTNTDAILTNTVTVQGLIVGFTMSQDSSTAWMVTNTSFNSLVTQIDVASRAQSQAADPLVLPFGGASSIALAPNGLLYVAGHNVFFEIMPSATDSSQCVSNGAPPLCITPNGTIDNVGINPGPMHFTPAGDFMYVVNTNVALGPSIFQIHLSDKVVTSWPPPNVQAPQFTDVYIVSPTEMFAVSAADTTLWDINTPPLTAVHSSVLANALPVTNVAAIALSNEIPTARYLYALVTQNSNINLVRVDLSTNSVSSSVLSNLPLGTLQFLTFPPQSGAANFFLYNSTQTVGPGKTALPLNAIVLDGKPSGRPVYNVPVTFAPADPASGITVTQATPRSNSNGFVTAMATIPANATPGNYGVTLTSGTATQTFTLTVPGGNNNGGGNNEGNSQITIVSGNGMLVPGFAAASTPLTVLVTDQDGKPLSGQKVTFTIEAAGCGTSTPGPGTVTAFSTTDANGLATATFFGFPPNNFHSFQVTDVNASTSVGAVDFCETSFVLNTDGTGLPQIILVAPTGSRVISAGEGDTVINAVEAEILAAVEPDFDLPIPNVGIRLTAAGDPTQPGPASCVGNALSDQTGLARCSLKASCQLQNTQFSASIGELFSFPLSLQVGTGSGRKLTAIAGDKQTGNTGQTLPLNLAAIATDNCGNPVSGATVAWQVVSGSATLQNPVTQSNINGDVQATVVLGQTAGPIQVSVSLSGGTPVLFNLTSVAAVKSLTLVSGSLQTTTVNQVFTNPVVVQLKDSNGNPVPNLQVSFGVTAGFASVTPTATTGADGKASATVTAGVTPGQITITATYGNLSATATETATAVPPSISSASFYSAATVGSPSAQQGLVPCGLGSLVGGGIAAGINGVVLANGPLGLGPMPYVLGGFSMTINTIPVPLLSISNVNGVQQVNYQTPCETSASGPATAVVTVNGNPATISGIPVLASQPGIINYSGANNVPYGFIISGSDGSYVTPNNPMVRGGTYYVILTGLGQTTPPIATNSAGTGSQNIPLANVIVGLNGAGIPVTLAEYAVGQAGLYVVGFQVPKDASPGPNEPLVVAIISNGALNFSNVVYVPNLD